MPCIVQHSPYNDATVTIQLIQQRRELYWSLEATICMRAVNVDVVCALLTAQRVPRIYIHGSPLLYIHGGR